MNNPDLPLLDNDGSGPGDKPKAVTAQQVAAAIVQAQQGQKPTATQLRDIGEIRAFEKSHAVLNVMINSHNGQTGTVALKPLIEKAKEADKDYIVFASSQDSNRRSALSVENAEALQQMQENIKTYYKLPQDVPLHISGNLKPEAAAEYGFKGNKAVPTKTVLSMGKLNTSLQGLNWTMSHEGFHEHNTVYNVVPDSRKKGPIDPSVTKKEETLANESATKRAGRMGAFISLGQNVCSSTTASSPDLTFDQKVSMTHHNLQLNLQEMTQKGATHQPILHHLQNIGLPAKK